LHRLKAAVIDGTGIQVRALLSQRHMLKSASREG